MRLGIVNQHASTGGWKYLSLLVEGITKIDSNIDITIFYAYIKDSEVYFESIKKLGIKMVEIPIPRFSKKEISKIKFINKIYNYIRKKRFKIRNRKNIEISNQKISTFERNIGSMELLFYSWPYNFEPYLLNCPVCFIPHDFIFTHFFGFHSCHLYTREWYFAQKAQLKKFVERGRAIVSTPYVAKEFKREYPEYSNMVDVVYLSAFNDANTIGEQECKKILKKYDIKHDFILYANNWGLHKNMQDMVGAMYWIKQKHPNLKLIVTGYGTNGLYCQANTPFYWDHVEDTKEYDIKSLGLIEEDEFLPLMKSAKVVINSSLCEAGPGSTADAWRIGTPVAMSDIEPFRQYQEYIGGKAEFFDPKNSKDTAEKILKIIDNPNLAKEYSKISKEALDRYTWQNVAKQYIEIFKKTYDEFHRK